MRYTCNIKKLDEVVNNKAFLVMLLNVPDFPNDKPLDKVVRSPLQAVIGATDDNEPRSFINLNRDEKHCIGDALQVIGSPSGEWKYCELYEVAE